MRSHLANGRVAIGRAIDLRDMRDAYDSMDRAERASIESAGGRERERGGGEAGCGGERAMLI